MLSHQVSQLSFKYMPWIMSKEKNAGSLSQISSLIFAIRVILVVLLRWRHNERDGVSNHQHIHCLLNLLFRRRSKKTSKLRVTGLCDETFSTLLSLCAGNLVVTSGFPSQRPVTRNFDVYFDLCLNKRLRKESRRWWFETPSRSLLRHCNEGSISKGVDGPPFQVKYDRD